MSMLCVSMYDPTDIIPCYDYDVKLKKDPLRELMFSKFLKLNLCMSTVFIIKPEVVRTMTMTQWLSSRDPTEKSCIPHSYVFVSSLEDADIGHGGHIHWASGHALTLRLGAKYICHGRASSHEDLLVPPPWVLCTSDEPVLLSTLVIWWYHLGWYPLILPTTEVSDKWRVRLRHSVNADCFLGFRSSGVILPELPCGVWPLWTFLPISDSPDFLFIIFICSSSSRTTPDLWSWVYPYLRCASWTWACPRRRTWRWYTRWIWERISSVWWVM